MINAISSEKIFADFKESNKLNTENKEILMVAGFNRLLASGKIIKTRFMIAPPWEIENSKVRYYLSPVSLECNSDSCYLVLNLMDNKHDIEKMNCSVTLTPDMETKNYDSEKYQIYFRWKGTEK